MDHYPLKAPRRDRVIIVKVTEAERHGIITRAGVHTGGNVSQWIRKSSLSFEPEKLDDGDDAC